MKKGNPLFENLKKRLPGIKKNVPLKNYTTFKIGGAAEYFFIAKHEKDVMKAVKVAKSLKIPVFTFGGGSNLLVSENGISGLVVRMQSFEKTFSVKKKGDTILVQAPGGVPMKHVVSFAVAKGFKGLEWAGGLPGTFGGAIRGNAGAFGGEMKDSIEKVRALTNDFKIRTFSHRDCQFAYRTSIFKKKNWVALSATINLKKGDKKALKETMNSRIAYRNEKHPLEFPNAGSVFKNVDFKALIPKFQEQFADKVKQDPFPIVPAAWFIIGAGLAGKQIGQAQISKKHSNYIVNLGGAKATDVLELIKLAQREVKRAYGVELEPEVQFVGFSN
jgi:UDP-N-acetylmuramate dehydrogenase